MSHELLFTSAPRGLRPGSSGYCTVTATRGLPGPLLQKLESLSDYRPLEGGGDAAGGRSPVALTHLRVSVLGKTYNVLSRSCAAGVDHTHRAIFFTHHIALEPAELPAGGPAWLAGQRGFLETRWDGQVRELPEGRRPPPGNSAPGVCRAWEQLVGDAGWAGVLAEEFEKNPSRPAYLLYPLGLDVLPLLTEALALLPPDRRWQVTFSTFYRPLPPDVACAWRCLPREAAEARKVQSQPGVLVLDLARAFGPAAGGVLVEAARSGKAPPVYSPTPARGVPPQAPAPMGGRKAAVVSPVVEAEPRVEAAGATYRAREPEPSGRRGSWLVPLALGVMLGMLLASGGAVAGWWVLEKEKARIVEAERAEREKALAKAEEERQAALEKARQEAKAQTLKAVGQARQEEKGRADSDRTAAEASARNNYERGLKQVKADEEKRAVLRIEQARREATVVRDKVLDTLASQLFSRSDDQAVKIKSLLQAVQKGEAARAEDLKRLLDRWLRSESEEVLSKHRHADRTKLQSDLASCKALYEKQKGKVADNDTYRTAYENVRKRCADIERITPSVLVQKEMQRVKEELAELPEPTSPRKKP